MNIFFMGPMPPPYHGQSVAFSMVVNKFISNQNGKYTIVDISNRNSILKGISLCFKISFYMLFYKYNVVYFTCSRSFSGSIRDIVLLFFCRIRKLYTVNHLHGDNFKSFYDNQSKLYKSIIKWCYKGVHTSIVLIDNMKKEFADFPDMNIEVVPNCYSSALDTLPIRKNRETNSLNILYLSNIMKAKGILNLLIAFDKIAHEDKRVKLHIAGQFIEDYLASEKEIEVDFFKLYEDLKEKYPERIKYYGAVIGETKSKLLWQSDIFILPTFHKTEAFPISLLEAMRSGNYIISTNHNYITSIISENSGTLITPNSIDAIIEAFQNIRKNTEKINTIQNNNITQAINSYQEKKYLSKTISIITKNNPV